MNWPLLKWYAALLALIWGVFVIALGASLLALFLFGIIDLALGAVGAFALLNGSLSLYGAYRWFTAGVSEEDVE